MLPPITVESPWWMEIEPVVRAAEDAFGCSVTVLRLLAGERFPGGPVTYLVEAPDVRPELLGAWAGALERDDKRASYAETGGPTELLGWARRAMEQAGLAATGKPVQGRSWNLAATWQIPTTAGPIWLKATPPFLDHEAAVLQLLGSAVPGAVPALIAGSRGRVLMHHVGGVDGYDVDQDEYLRAVVVLRSMQDLVEPSDLLHAGVPLFGAPEMSEGIARLLDRHGEALPADERHRLVALHDEVQSRFDRCAAVPDGLVHGDFHGGNLRVSPPGSLIRAAPVVLDWGDSFVGNPLFDLIALDGYYEQWPASVRDRWLDTWDLPEVDLSSAWQALRPLAALKLAITYQMFCDNIEGAEQAYHRDDVVPAIRRGLNASA